MNIIVLVSDTFRYDYLGCNGNGWIGTAALDRLAGRAVSFDRHYLSSFPTIPNRTDLFTGRYTFPFHGWKPLDPGLPVLSTIFGAAGYQSQLICDTPHLDEGDPPLRPGLRRGVLDPRPGGRQAAAEGQPAAAPGGGRRQDPRRSAHGRDALRQPGDPALVDQSRLGLGGGPLLRAHGAHGEPLAGGEPGAASPSCCGWTSSMPTSPGTRRSISWPATTPPGTPARR